MFIDPPFPHQSLYLLWLLFIHLSFLGILNLPHQDRSICVSLAVYYTSFNPTDNPFPLGWSLLCQSSTKWSILSALNIEWFINVSPHYHVYKCRDCASYWREAPLPSPFFSQSGEIQARGWKTSIEFGVSILGISHKWTEAIWLWCSSLREIRYGMFSLPAARLFSSPCYVLLVSINLLLWILLSKKSLLPTHQVISSIYNILYMYSMHLGWGLLVILYPSSTSLINFEKRHVCLIPWWVST